jgi:hypothetical protein
MTRHEALLLAFPNADINTIINAIDKAENERKLFCKQLLAKAEKLKKDAKNAENESILKNKSKRK